MKRSPVRIGIILCAAIAVSLLYGSANPVNAQTPTVTVSVDRTNLTLTDVLTLTLDVDDLLNMQPLPPPPSIPGMIVVGSKRSSETRFENGALSARFKFEFTYQPTRTGTIEIEPISVLLDGVVHVTSPITITVTAGSGQAAPQPAGPVPATTLAGQDFHAEAEVDNERPYIGEQITYALRFYSASIFGRPIYDSPDFAGFWNPGRSDEDEKSVIAAGRRYDVRETKTILFPTLAGVTTIEPASVTIQGGGLFGTGRSQFPTTPIELQVRPLPPNEPSSFTGAVGRYTIVADIDADQVSLDEPVTVKLTVTGEGNVEALPGPIWPQIDGWRAFDSDTTHRMSVIDGKLQGFKTFERVLIPDVAGSYEFPALDYAYFDPGIEGYVTLSSQSFRVNVLPGPGAAPAEPPVASVSEEDTAPELRYIKPVPESLGRPRGLTATNSMYWGLWLTPLGAILIMTAWLLISGRRRQFEGPDGQRRESAAALMRLGSIEPGTSSADAAGRALHSYLSTVLGRPTGGLAASEISDLLTERGVSTKIAAQLKLTVDRVSEMRFAPQEHVDAREIGPEVSAVVRELAEELAEEPAE